MTPSFKKLTGEEAGAHHEATLDAAVQRYAMRGNWLDALLTFARLAIPLVDLDMLGADRQALDLGRPGDCIMLYLDALAGATSSREPDQITQRCPELRNTKNAITPITGHVIARSNEGTSIG